MIDKHFLDELSPVEIEYIKSHIDSLFKLKMNSKTTNYENLKKTICRCPHYKSRKIIKYSYNPNHKQKYRCNGCNKIFVPTTSSLFFHSKVSYDQWSSFITCEINRNTFAEEVVITGHQKLLVLISDTNFIK